MKNNNTKYLIFFPFSQDKFNYYFWWDFIYLDIMYLAYKHSYENSVFNWRLESSATLQHPLY